MEKLNICGQALTLTETGGYVKSIPSFVWEEVRNGRGLPTAYARYEYKRMRADLEAERAGDAAKEKTAGPRASTGKAAETNIHVGFTF